MTSDVALTAFQIRIDREGNWFYNNQAITNENVRLYFNQNILRDDKGNYLLKIKDQVCPLTVEDTPFVVKHVKVTSESKPRAMVALNDRTNEIVSWDQIWLKGDAQIYCLVKQGEFEARFNRNSQFEFAQVLQFDDEKKRYYLEVEGTRHYLSERG